MQEKGLCNCAQLPAFLTRILPIVTLMAKPTRPLWLAPLTYLVLFASLWYSCQRPSGTPQPKQDRPKPVLHSPTPNATAPPHQSALSRVLAPIVKALTPSKTPAPAPTTSTPQASAQSQSSPQGQKERETPKDPNSDSAPPQLLGIEFTPPQVHDGEEAMIVVGQNLPFVGSAAANAGLPGQIFNSVERQNVGITLDIVPQISDGDYVKLDVYEEVSALVDNSDHGLGPTTTLRSASTTVLVQNHRTTVIGTVPF